MLLIGESTGQEVTLVTLYPSWIEIPVHDLDRATAFYQSVFRLDEIFRYDEQFQSVVVLRASDKGAQSPGVSLVQSPMHTPSPHGVVVNFHLGPHADMVAAMAAVTMHGGETVSRMLDAGEGVSYQHVRDSEGNTIALSSQESHIGT